MKRALLAVMLFAGASALAIYTLRDAGGDSPAPERSAGSTTSATVAPMTSPATVSTVPAPPDAASSQGAQSSAIHYPHAVPTVAADEAAAATIAAQRNLGDFIAAGDPRSPPIVRAGVDEPLPTAAELADPVAYARYESNQHSQLVARFALAARGALVDLHRDIERAIALGATAAQIREAEDKEQHLKAVLDRIDPVTGELAPAP